MPGPRAFIFRNSDEASGAITSNIFDVSPSETYSYSYFSGAVAGGPSIRSYVQWLDESLAQVGVAGIVNADAIGIAGYRQFGAGDLVPPAGATKARLVFYLPAGNAGTGAATQWSFVTGATLRKVGAFDFTSSAAISELKTTVANNNVAFTQYIASSNSRMNNIEANTSSLSTAVNQRATIASVNSAIGSLTSSTNAQIGRISAGGQMRVYSMANTDIGISRIGISVDADNANTTSHAALYLEARSDGTNQCLIRADRFAIMTNYNNTAARAVPFYIQGNAVYMSNTIIREASIGRLHIGNNELFVPYTFAQGGEVTITSANPKSSPVLVMDRTIPDFTGGGYMVSFTCYARGGDSWGSAYMVIDGVAQPITRFGVRTSLNSNARYSIPVQLFGTATGSGTTNIKIYFYNSHWDSDDYGSNDFHISQRRITLSGTRR